MRDGKFLFSPKLGMGKITTDHELLTGTVNVVDLSGNGDIALFEDWYIRISCVREQYLRLRIFHDCLKVLTLRAQDYGVMMW